ncbi:Chromate resistance protein ChrB [Microlunatus ginsengisoli]|uniref:ChrB N-terminal domain-containing protein n=1 Tax=Microlunatus ginsengisoli TaxID=363863 RepID=A0ABP6ZB86_9ACTN
MNIDDEQMARRWLVLLTRMPAEPARHRMALWRELRRSGALLLGPSAWAIPDIPAADDVIQRANQLAEAAGGTLLALSASGYAAADADRLENLYTEARNEEWTEFLADCGKYLAELAKEEAAGKYTLAELEEEEQSLDRLRRWYRELRSRDLLGAAAVTTATTQLKVCQEQFETYAEHVYTALNGGSA